MLENHLRIFKNIDGAKIYIIKYSYVVLKLQQYNNISLRKNNWEQETRFTDPSNWISSIDPVQGVLLSRNSMEEKDIFGSIEIISPSLSRWSRIKSQSP